jgi:hypothetical protein
LRIYAAFTRATSECAAMELLILFIFGALGVGLLLARIWRRRESR